MVLPLAYYGNPVLREKGARVEGVTEELASFVDDMFETMEEYRGIGLAAQQVGRALQLMVIDIRPVEDRPSTLELDGEEADPHSLMPLTLINPEITPLNDPVKGPEGCLSFPEMYGDISRPEKVRVTGMGRNGEALDFVCGGLLARCVQHENDHLQGILFVDRMDRKTKDELREELLVLQEQTTADLAAEPYDQ